ncbi:MAG: TM0996/MTH895 family glutaredoxin-like protein [Candidatus Omnitrophica bacterium]|nr:TM0996/MTH895 family glutaredoxin-like protein [Candidatus Omnitrophota bacterium]
MKVEILGTGCPKCEKLCKHAEEAIRIAGVEAEIVKITKLSDISSYGVMVTPALAIDGTVKVAGKIPTADEITKWLA